MKCSKAQVWFQTHQPDKQHSWLEFLHCFWSQGSQWEHVHLSLLPVGIKAQKNRCCQIASKWWWPCMLLTDVSESSFMLMYIQDNPLLIACKVRSMKNNFILWYWYYSKKKKAPLFITHILNCWREEQAVNSNLVIWIRSTSMAFLIILASNSAGVSISPMISLSRFFDSSDFRSFIRSYREQSNILCCYKLPERCWFSLVNSTNSSHPSQEGFEGLSNLLPLSIASPCNNVNDCIFICSCRY